MSYEHNNFLDNIDSTSSIGLNGPTGYTGPTGSFGPTGSNYGEYIYWDDSTSEWTVGTSEIKIGLNAGKVSQGILSIAIGENAGFDYQRSGCVAIGNEVGRTYQGENSVAIGNETGFDSQGSNAVAIGRTAAYNNQSEGAVAIGKDSGSDGQGLTSIAIGNQAGYQNQGGVSIAIGNKAGFGEQNGNSIAIGNQAGNTSQGTTCLAIGSYSGELYQGRNAVALGNRSGRSYQGTGCVALGTNAGNDTQGENSVAIGRNAGYTDQGPNSIIINSSGEQVNSTGNDNIVITSTGPFTAIGSDRLYISSIKEDTSSQLKTLHYNPSTFETTWNDGIETYHTIWVSTEGDDTLGVGSIEKPYLTIKKALSTITDSSSVNRYSIFITPGKYVEDNPLQMTSYTSISSIGEQFTVRIDAGNPMSNMFEMESFNEIQGVSLFGATGASVFNVDKPIGVVLKNCSISSCLKGLSVNDPIAQVIMNDISTFNFSDHGESVIDSLAGKLTINNCSCLTDSKTTDFIRLSGTGTNAFITGCVSESNQLDNAVYIADGAKATLMGSSFKGTVDNRIGKAICATGAGTEIDIFSTYIQHADYGICADGQVKIDAHALSIEDCQNGLYTHTTGNENITYLGGGISRSIDWDIYLSDSTASLVGSGMKVDENKLYLDSASVNMSHMSTNTGDAGMAVKGELHVGSPENGSEAVFGEGDSYVRGIVAYSYASTGATGVYTDISTAVKSFDGSTFTFPNNSVDTSIYIASDLVVNGTSDYHKSYGIKMLLTTPQSTGTIEPEYYNGTGWTGFNTMTCQSSDNYYRKSNQLFNVSPTGSYQVRYNPFISTDWAKSNDPSYSGGDRYFMRYRITQSPSILPVFEQWKLHTNRTELNGDGFRESMGNARSYVSIPVNWNLFKDSGGSILGNQDLWNTTNCNAGLANNLFNSDGDAVGTITSIPSWVDTSAPLKLLVALVSENTGNLTMDAYLNKSSEGDIISTSNPVSTTGEVNQQITKAVIAGQQVWFEFNLDICNFGNEEDGGFPDILWVNIKATTRPGNIYGMLFDLSMLNWRIGQHV